MRIIGTQKHLRILGKFCSHSVKTTLALLLLNNNCCLTTYAENRVKPAYNYFKQKFEVELKPLVEIFKYAQFFDPSKVGELKPSSSDIDNLKVFPFLKDRLEELKRELPKPDGVSPELDKLEWWKNHQLELPNWSRACKTTLLIQPSSAAAECVFSLLSNGFKESQTSALEDYIKTSLMVQYNGRG